MHIEIEDDLRNGPEGGKNTQNHFSDDMFQAPKHQY